MHDDRIDHLSRPRPNLRLDLSGDDPPADCSPGGIGLDGGGPLETRDFVNAVRHLHALHEMTHPVEPVLVGPLSRRRRLAQVLHRHLGVADRGAGVNQREPRQPTERARPARPLRAAPR